MTKAMDEFLAAEGASDEERFACELALVEACNNAVLYATQEGRKLTIDIEAEVDDDQIELHVHDHTTGFRLPDLSNLPEDENEHGRGIFIMRSLMDKIDYRPAEGGNTLTLTKRRYLSRPTVVNPAIAELQKRLNESEEIINDMTNELSSCYEGLSAILRAGAELGKTNNLSEFSHSLGGQLLEITESDWYVLRIVPKNESRLVTFAATPTAATLAPLSIGIFCDSDLTAEMKAALKGRDVWFNQRNPLDPCDPLRLSFPDSFGVVHPFFFADTLMGTLTVGKAMGRPAFNAANAQVINTFSEFFSIQIANARLREEQISHQLVTRELEIARTIQLTLLPRALPRVKNLELAGYYESARQVGGDFYDVVPLGEDKVLLIIADVMGKGIPAAIFAAIFRSLIRSTPELNDQPGALLARVNRQLFNDLSEVDMFITAQVVFVDLASRSITAANAGHCPVLITGESGTLTSLVPDGLPIGISQDTRFAEINQPLPARARILVYTDGITDTRNPKAETFGHQRLAQWLEKNHQMPVPNLKKHLIAELAAFRQEAALYDDQTFLLVGEEEQ
jgi:serine phosphatase RsbU (regulator of sigma subunit)/anti-sigma regulatory factor (Ser/Thr protein kinase)